MTFLRVFVVALYKGGMRRLLLRAEKTASHPSRIDVLFVNTHYIDLPTVMEGVVISDVTDSTSGRHRLDALGLSRDDEIRVYEVVSGDRVGSVLAGAVAYVQDDGEYWEPSSFPMDP